MNVNVLEVGKTFKNYKDMCIELGLEIKKSANSRNAQFKELSRYCKYSKIGHKITIDEVFDTIHDKVDNRGSNSIYRDVTQLLITDLLAQSKGHISISKSKLMVSIGLVNMNYSECKEEIPKLSKFTELNKNIIFDFYNMSASSFNWIIESSLDNLMDKRVIMYKKIIKVAEKHKDDDEFRIEVREAFAEELEDIMLIEKEELEYFGYEQMSQVRMSRHWKQFRNRTQNRAKNVLGIEYYYTAYDIIINDEYIVKERNKLASLLLEKVKRQESKNELNNLIYTNLIKNAEKRHDKGFTNGKRAKMRMDDDYISNIKQLADLLIDINHPYIAQQIKQIRINNLDCPLNKEIEKEMERLFG